MRSCEPVVSVRSAVCESVDAFWDVDDLIERLCGALDFAECAVRELSLDDAERPAGAESQRLIADTGRLLLAASSAESYAAVGPRITRVADLLLPHALSATVLRAICLEPAMAFEHAAAYICLKRLGYYDPDVDALLDLSVAAQASGGRERVPHRILEQEWLKQGWLYPEGLPRLKAGTQMAHCALNKTRDLLAGSREDIRSFTRALMCLRDFNLFPRPLPRARETLLAEAEGMLARCLEQEDYDLAAEVLLAWPLTCSQPAACWSPAAAFGFRVVMGVRPRGCGSFAGGYQGVYAMAMLCAACLAPRKRPPVHLPAAGVRAGVFAAMLKHMECDARWREELDEIDVAGREPLAEFVLQIGLHRAFRQGNFAAMAQLLSVAKGMRLGSSPMAAQATEMMVRVASCGLKDVPEPSKVDRRESLNAELNDQEAVLCMAGGAGA